MIGYVPGSGWLYRSHPFAAFLLAGGILVAAACVPGPVAPVVLAGGAILLPLVAATLPAARTAAVLSLPFWLFLMVIHGAIGGDPLKALVLGSRLTAIIFGFTAVVSTAHPGRVTEALVQAGAPFGVAYLFSATLQTIARLRERAVAIMETQQCRGLDLRGPIIGRLRNVAPLAVPLVLGALTEIDARAVALETRGAGSGRRRTCLDPPPWRRSDQILAAFSVLVAVGAVAWRWA